MFDTNRNHQRTQKLPQKEHDQTSEDKPEFCDQKQDEKPQEELESSKKDDSKEFGNDIKPLIDDQNEFSNFNISFLLPKDLCKNIVEDEENSDNKNNDNTIEDNNILNEENNDNVNDNDNDLNKIKDNDLTEKENDINEDFSISNYIDIQNAFSNLSINNNKEINQKLKNNVDYIEGNNSRIGRNLNQDNNCLLNNQNINNYIYFVNNNNNTQINFQFNNNPINNNNIFYSPNHSNLMNFPQTPNNQPLYFLQQNALINQNMTNNYIFNNNSEIPGFYQNQFSNNNPQLFQINNINNNKCRRKKPFNEYITQMFGRRGWICDLCNNFNYEKRKKCNKCQMMKKPKKIDEYFQTKLNSSFKYKNYWICKYCGNNNFLFRLVCNRCQAKKEVN